jgi:hypothetical protein
MVLAVLQRRADVKIGKQDVYAATVGGVRLTEPSVDLAVALALASSVANLSVPQGVIAVGEVGLAGEVRNVAGVPRRVAEAERMGFRRAIVPTGSDAASSGGSSGMKVLTWLDWPAVCATASNVPVAPAASDPAQPDGPVACRFHETVSSCGTPSWNWTGLAAAGLHAEESHTT